MKKLLPLVVLALLVSAIAASAATDTYVKSRSHTDAMAVAGQSVPAKDEVVESWISGNRMATMSGQMTLIVDADKGLLQFINHADKSYVETTLPMDFSKLLPPEAAAMAGMFQMTATVTPVSETRKIGQWDCAGYDVVITVMGMPMNMKIWATTNVPFDLTGYTTKLAPALAQGQMRLDAKSAAEFGKMKGFPISTEMTADMMGAKLHSTTEVVEMASKAAPAGTFEPPAGFTKKSTFSMGDLQRR